MSTPILHEMCLTCDNITMKKGTIFLLSNIGKTVSNRFLKPILRQFLFYRALKKGVLSTTYVIKALYHL